MEFVFQDTLVYKCVQRCHDYDTPEKIIKILEKNKKNGILFNLSFIVSLNECFKENKFDIICYKIKRASFLINNKNTSNGYASKYPNKFDDIEFISQADKEGLNAKRTMEFYVTKKELQKMEFVAVYRFNWVQLQTKEKLKLYLEIVTKNFNLDTKFKLDTFLNYKILLSSLCKVEKKVLKSETSRDSESSNKGKNIVFSDEPPLKIKIERSLSEEDSKNSKKLINQNRYLEEKGRLFEPESETDPEAKEILRKLQKKELQRKLFRDKEIIEHYEKIFNKILKN